MVSKLPDVLESALDSLPESPSGSVAIARKALTRLFFEAAKPMSEGRIFISTGDIPAMWLRDSSFQVKPLMRFSTDRDIYAFISQVIAAQSFFISIDPYANAFNVAPNGLCWQRDFKNQSPWVFERKWEVDSLISHLQVSIDLAEWSKKRAHLTPDWWRSIEILISTLEREQLHEPASYRFLRKEVPAHDYLSHDGYGSPFKSEGLVWSAFRPSDDACSLPFNIPQNAYAAAQLKRFAALPDNYLATRALKLSQEISDAITRFGTNDGIYAYEVDCLGNQLFMDDANIPSLLSLPYLGFGSKSDPTYLKTREYVLSKRNPWFFEGKTLGHIGSQHTGAGRIWPLAMAMEIITSESVDPIMLAKLADTASSNGALHESIAVDDPSDFTREWFSWAEMTFVDALFSVNESMSN